MFKRYLLMLDYLANKCEKSFLFSLLLALGGIGLMLLIAI